MGLLVDISEIEKVVRNADVFAVGFRLFPERLLIDTRHDDTNPEGPCGTPLVAIVDPVESVEERYFWLGKHRPTLGMPEAFMYFFWPHSVRYLQESGIWGAIRERIVSSGFTGAAETCDAALEDLLERERGANIEAIAGARYRTLWSAQQPA
jgi:hypothetical protein